VARDRGAVANPGRHEFGSLAADLYVGPRRKDGVEAGGEDHHRAAVPVGGSPAQAHDIALGVGLDIGKTSGFQAGQIGLAPLGLTEGWGGISVRAIMSATVWSWVSERVWTAVL